MNEEKNISQRVFKTVWFTKAAKAAKKARIKDSELYEAIQQVVRGQVVDLGGGVFKKRLNENNYRSIKLERGDRVLVSLSKLMAHIMIGLKDDVKNAVYWCLLMMQRAG